MTTAPRPDSVDASRPLFVVLDGVDGCGKTTQAKRLVEALESEGRRPLHLREPGSTPAGERIRDLVLDPAVRLGPGALALLFTAARRQTLEELVAPALAQGRDVVIERFHASTFAYQGRAARGAAESHPSASASVPTSRAAAPPGDAELLALLSGWAGEPKPTVELVLDLTPDEAFARAVAREGGASDRFEARGVAFQESVAAGMRSYVSRVPHAVRIDARGTESDVAARVLAAVMGAARVHGQV